MTYQAKSFASWKNNRSIIHDITSYYSYLPAVFIYQDLDFNYRYDLPQDEPVDHVWVNTKGDSVFQKMSIGLSYFYSPTFLLAHYYSKNFTDYNANGFSKPYQKALNINTLIFAFLGLLLTWLICIRLFNDIVSAICVVLIFLGTNLLYYISIAPGLSHVYSYFLVALLYLLTISYFKKPKTFLFALMSVVMGLIVLVRPTNGILCLFPLLYGIQPMFRNNLSSLFKRPLNYILFIVLFLLPWIPQFLYWKYATGQFLFYSYDQEGFFFTKPHILDGLFSYRKGWLVYSPLMGVSLLGMFIGRKFKELRRPLLIILPLFVYVVFSWWCWWYGGSFGSRVMIDSYPLLIVGLGLMVEQVIHKKWYAKLPLVAVLSFMLILNLQQVWQYSIGMLHWDSMTKKAYWSIFMKDKPPGNFQDLLEAPDYQQAMKEGE